MVLTAHPPHPQVSPLHYTLSWVTSRLSGSLHGSEPPEFRLGPVPREMPAQQGYFMEGSESKRKAVFLQTAR